MDAIMFFSSITVQSSNFVLCLPDLDSNHIRVDENGNVTGLVNWDIMTRTMPQCLSYTAYPDWITRDFDQSRYAWPTPDHTDSPAESKRYRAYYDEELGKALNCEGNWKFTKDSHIVEAIWLIAVGEMGPLGTSHKLVRIALDTDIETALGMLHDIAHSDYYDGDWDELEAILPRLIIPSPKPELLSTETPGIED